MKNQLKAGVLISYATILVSNIIPMIYTPIMLRILGQAEYGVYGIANSISNYLYLLNMGFGSTIIRYLSKYRANGEKDKEEQVAGMFFQVYCVLSIIIAIMGGVIAANIQHYGNALSAVELERLRTLVILNTINTALFMPMNVMGSILVAHEKYVVNKGVALFTTILTPFLNLAFLYTGIGSVGFPIVTIITNLIGYSIYTPYAIKRIGIRPRFGKPDWPLLREIFGFTLFVFMTRVIDSLFWSTDNMIIGWSLGSVATAVYNIGAVFNSHVSTFSTAISGVLVPKLTAMEVKNASDKEFTGLFIRVGRIQFMIVAFIISAFIAFGRQFIALWAGTGYEDSYFIAILTMIPSAIGMIQSTGVNMLYARNKHKFRAVAFLGVAVLNISLTCLWVERYGIIGAALATCIACVLGDGIIMNWYYHVKMRVNIPLFWKNIVKMMPVSVIMGALAWIVLDRIIVMDQWLVFFAAAIMYTVVYFVLAYAFVMNAYERALILVPIKKLKSRFAKKAENI